MSKTLHISGALAIICLLVARVSPYFEGLAFDKFWSVPMGVLPLGLIALLTFLASTVICAVAVLRKRQSPKNLLMIGLFPVLVVVLYQTPFPSYVDGMHKTLSESLSPEQLAAFVEDVRLGGAEWEDGEEHDQIMRKLEVNHPEALGLSRIPPRVDVSDKYVSVFYGSALVKHWGYLIGDLEKFPIEHIPEGMYRKVYEGVWVYHDIW